MYGEGMEEGGWWVARHLLDLRKDSGLLISIDREPKKLGPAMYVHNLHNLHNLHVHVGERS